MMKAHSIIVAVALLISLSISVHAAAVTNASIIATAFRLSNGVPVFVTATTNAFGATIIYYESCDGSNWVAQGSFTYLGPTQFQWQSTLACSNADFFKAELID